MIENRTNLNKKLRKLTDLKYVEDQMYHQINPEAEESQIFVSSKF